jgi:polygalacturonase
MNIRNHPAGIPVIIAGLLLFTFTAKAQSVVWTTSKQPLQEIEQLRKQIKAPLFKNQDFIITDFGATGDGMTKNTEAFRKAIDACVASGGGRVVVPAGKFLTGAIYLKSNVNLYLQNDATILFSHDTTDYPIVFTRWEGMECMNYSPLIYAYGEQNIAVTGTGTLDGNASSERWWNWNGKRAYGWMPGMPNQQKARDTLHVMMHKNIDPRQRVFGNGHYLRPNMLQPYNCKNVLISGVKMLNSPMWFINPVLCENVIVEKVNIQSKGINTDGCDPEACKNVLIRNCYFDTGDDCIAIKSGRDEDGRRIGRPAENHLIENCEMKDGHGGVVIGSEIAGGARNIYAINCTMSSPDLERVLRIKTSSSRGGIIENVFMKNIKVGTYKDAAIHCNMFYEKPGNFMPVIRNIWVEDLEVLDGGEFGVYVHAYEKSPVQHLKLVNCHINGVKTPMKIDHVKDMELKQVTINGERVEMPGTLISQ